MQKEPEILAPAGSPECVLSAVRSGADAVYLGTKAFNARRGAENFSDEDLQKAIENYTELYESVDNVSTLLSVKHNEVVEAVKNLKLEIQKANAKNMELQNKLNTEKIKNIEKQKNIIYFEENIPSKEMKNLLNKLKEKAEDVVVLFSIENNICKYMIESEKIDVTSIGKSINEKFNGRGGGKKNFVQGQICGKREEIDTFVKSILE